MTSASLKKIGPQGLLRCRLPRGLLRDVRTRATRKYKQAFSLKYCLWKVCYGTALSSRLKRREGHLALRRPSFSALHVSQGVSLTVGQLNFGGAVREATIRLQVAVSGT